MTTITERRFGHLFDELVTASGLCALAGVWLLLSAFLLNGGSGLFLINNIICGALAAPLALGAFARARLTWLTAAIGVWLMVSPWVLGFVHNEAGMWNNLFTGIVITALALWSRSIKLEAAPAESPRSAVQ